MTRRSATNGHESTYSDLPFKEAARLTTRAWSRKHKTACLPLSHALSDFRDGVWTVRDSEVGEVVAEVQDGVAVLTEDI